MGKRGRSLLEEMGLDEETISWRKLALCNGMPLSAFFEDYENDKVHAEQMDSICLRCPVMSECLSDAIRDKDYGLRGAIYLSAGKRDRQNNEHKTDEVWARFEEKLREGR